MPRRRRPACCAWTRRSAGSSRPRSASSRAAWPRPGASSRTSTCWRGASPRRWRPCASRAVALYADPERISARIQPHAPGFVELPEWVEIDLVSVVGPGVLSAALADAKARGFIDDEHGYAQAIEAEIARVRGRDAEAL